ncbi:unnamed protein product, partial [Meganyctiphanes norvegica]
GPMLPDLILDTPPPSPLRRAHSYHFTFPENSPHTDFPLTPTSSLPSLPSSPFSLPPTPSSLPPTPSTVNNELVEPMVSVEHIQAVRRKILADPEDRIPSTHLPQLTWDVPLPSHIRRSLPQPPIPQQETEEKKTQRAVGDDLRRIADKFHLDHVLVQWKSFSSNNLDIVLTLFLTRCLQVSIVAIICWRLLNKFG